MENYFRIVRWGVISLFNFFFKNISKVHLYDKYLLSNYSETNWK